MSKTTPPANDPDSSAGGEHEPPNTNRPPKRRGSLPGITGTTLFFSPRGDSDNATGGLLIRQSHIVDRQSRYRKTEHRAIAHPIHIRCEMAGRSNLSSPVISRGLSRCSSLACRLAYSQASSSRLFFWLSTVFRPLTFRVLIAPLIDSRTTPLRGNRITSALS